MILPIGSDDLEHLTNLHCVSSLPHRILELPLLYVPVPDSVGKLMNPANLMHRSFYPLLEKADLPRIRFHDLRHTAATLLLSQKVNVKVVSEMLGHADVATTMRIYAHVLSHMQDEAVEVMNNILESQA
jgi:integrase